MRALTCHGMHNVKVENMPDPALLADDDIIITHRMKLADAAEGYRLFNKKEQDCRRVVLVP